jgi:hypothetical protein
VLYIDVRMVTTETDPISIPSHDAVWTLIATDTLLLVAVILVIAGASDSQQGIAVLAYFLISAVVTFVWSCYRICRNPALPVPGQILFGLNAIPFAIVLAPLTLGGSILLVFGALHDDPVRRSWPYFPSSAWIGLFLLVLGVAVVMSWYRWI